MPIQRSGPTPAFWEYVVTNAAVPATGPPDQGVLTASHAGLQWIDIPSYQRGISWTLTELLEFLGSQSILLGNVILGQFHRMGGQFPHLPGGVNEYNVLVDGLQRFAIGTMLLAVLHDDVLAATPNRTGDATHFAPLAQLVGARAAVYQHNDVELRNHPRKAIAEQYAALRSDWETYVGEQFSGGAGQELADAVMGALMQKQVAVDTYFNFPSAVALMNTFLGLNTVRVDLGPVDLLRSYLVEKATSSGWPAHRVEEVENDFTEVFTRDERPDSELLPFVSVVLEYVRDNAEAPTIFPSWHSGLTASEVDDFLDFVQAFKNLTTDPYLNELRAVGSIPFGIVLAYYYRQKLYTHQDPSILTNGTAEHGELHALLRACYRTYFDGRIGRTRRYANGCLVGEYADLSAAGDAMSNEFLSTSLSSQVDRGWLVAALNRTDRKRAPRAFNAMLLPPPQPGGATFEPLEFGRRSTMHHVDHLLPESMLNANSPGEAEAHTLRNLAPLPTNQNREAKATSCSSKLAPTGIYDNYVQANLNPHPYSAWLVAAQGAHGAHLDVQDLLEPNQTPDIGTERINHIADKLEEVL